MADDPNKPEEQPEDALGPDDAATPEPAEPTDAAEALPPDGDAGSTAEPDTTDGAPAEDAADASPTEAGGAPVAADAEAGDGAEALNQDDLDNLAAELAGGEETAATEATAETPADAPAETPVDAAASGGDDEGGNALRQDELDAIADQLREAGFTGPTAPASTPASAPDDNALDQSELDALTAEISAAAGGAAPTAGGGVDVVAAADAGGDAGALDDELAAEMAAAIAAESGATDGPPAEAPTAAEPAIVGATSVRPPASEAEQFPEPELSAATPANATTMDMLDDVELDVKIELGRTDMYIEDVLRLGAGSVVELNKLAGDPVDIYVNERLIAHGEVLVLNDNFCVRINAIDSPIPELEQG
jgi:flagellar motor switch protein FliN/FliY